MIKPLRDVLFFTPIEIQDKIGGIYVTDSMKEEKNQRFVKAKVIAAGPACVLAKVGSTILVTEWSDTSKMMIDGVEVWNKRERDIVGVLN